MILSLLLTLFWQPAFASQAITDSFTSVKNFGSSGMVWNIAHGTLHPPLKVIGYDRGSGAEDYNFSVGDGRHGRFVDASSYRRLSCATVSGFLISIDTDQCSDLQFTEFHLLAGWTLRPSGSHPLLIRSLSSVTVDGTIDCSGENGKDGNSTFSTVQTGGVGRCGGGDGGVSVAPSIAPSAANRGLAGGTLITGGDGGSVQDVNGGKGGGGGGAYVKSFSGGTDSPDGTDGKDGLGVDAANVGTNYRDDAFGDDPIGAGSGGGGGSAYQSGVDPGNSSGGSGGAGGGSILIYAVDDVTINGSVLANGGMGGSVPNPYKAGAGGGGGGGSVVVMTVGDIVIDGTISAAAGSGGAANTGADGGTGYWGRTWVVEKDGFAGGLNIESPETQLNVVGNVHYETGVTYTVESSPIDLGNTGPTLVSAVTTLQDQGGSTLTFELAFGDSLSDVNLNTYNLPATYVSKQVGRFAKFRIQLDNLDDLVPAKVTLFTLTYDGAKQGQFDFTGACGRVAAGGSTIGARQMGLRLFLFMLPLLLFAYLRRLYLPAKAKL